VVNVAADDDHGADLGDGAAERGQRHHDERRTRLEQQREDPFERAADQSNTYWDWYIDRAYAIYKMQDLVAQQIKIFKEFPPRQKPASFNLDSVLEDLQNQNRGSS
jgi:arylsulfatase